MHSTGEKPFLLTAALILASLTLSGQVRAAPSDYGSLAPDTLYESLARSADGEPRLELRLLDGNFFVLRVGAAPPGGTARARDLTGNWRRLEGGALLQLTNAHGLALRLNVGGDGNLYGHFPFAPGEPTPSLALRQAPFRARPFSLMGKLESREGRTRLTDSASGRIFEPVTGIAPDALWENGSLFVDVEGLPNGGGFVIEKTRAVFAPPPTRFPLPPVEGDFAAVAGGGIWRLPPMPGLPAASCLFSVSAKGRGSLTVTGRGVRLTVAYEELRGQRLLFRIKKGEARKARAGGAEALLAMFVGECAWTLEKDALVLTTAAGASFPLERAAD
jgi:hypothetical protein